MASLKACVPSVASNVNIVLGDTIVWWRAWVLSPEKRAVRILSVVLLLGTSAMGFADTYSTCNDHFYAIPAVPSSQAPSAPGGRTIGPLNRYTLYGVIAVALSLLTSVSATAVIGYKTWQHRRFVKKYPHRSSRRTQVESILILLTESGVLYCLLLTVVVALGFKSLPGPKPHLAAIGDLASTLYIIGNGCLVPIIGMYPVVVIPLVALERSCQDTQIILRSSPPTPDSPPLTLPLHPVRSESTINAEALEYASDSSGTTRQETRGAELEAVGKQDGWLASSASDASPRLRVTRTRSMSV
ncbi:hypothetical protein BV20DRAFT_480744 [Pilatotrama ljubarskyi]|nr:hypothetical protein BV20DRAFT_480744 [Pilatotrama ljubarskyi]